MKVSLKQLTFRNSIHWGVERVNPALMRQSILGLQETIAFVSDIVKTKVMDCSKKINFDNKLLTLSEFKSQRVTNMM